MAITDLLSSDPVSAYRSKINDILDVVNIAARDLSGTLASRPAANSVEEGTYYFATDTGELARSDGSTWFILTPAAACAFMTTRTAALNLCASGAIDFSASEIYDLGGDYSGTTFTAPVKGLYEFTYAFNVQSITGGAYSNLALYKNGAALSAYTCLDMPISVTVQTYTRTVTVALALGDQMTVQSSGYSGTINVFAGALQSIFSGRLLAQLP